MLKVLFMACVVFIALALPISLLVIGGGKMWRERNASPPLPAEVADSLRASAERAANAALPTPTLGNERLTVECPPERVEIEVRRIVKLTRNVGGAASLWRDASATRVLANIPESTEEAFRQAVRDGTEDLAAAGSPIPTVIVDVLIQAPSAKVKANNPRR